jgi:hypothetical protein
MATASSSQAVFGFYDLASNHHFAISLDNKSDTVELTEDYGPRSSLVVSKYIRVSLTRDIFNMIESVVKLEFNKRLKAEHQSPGAFNKKGVTYIDRMLGKELATLMFAVEHVTGSGSIDAVRDIDNICKNWLNLDTCNRWWYYSQASAFGSAGQYDKDSNIRKGIYLMLSARPKQAQ